MKNYLLLLFSFTIFFLACPNDPEDEFPMEMDDPFDINIVTGIQLRDINANPIGAFGNPNVSTEQSVAAFPNPAGNALFVQVFEQDKTVTSCWLFPATTDTSFADVDYDNYLDGYTIAEIEDRTDLETFLPDAASFQLDLSGLSPGYYRIFYDLDTGERRWDNLYIDPTASDLNAVLEDVIGDW